MLRKFDRFFLFLSSFRSMFHYSCKETSAGNKANAMLYAPVGNQKASATICPQYHIQTEQRAQNRIEAVASAWREGVHARGPPRQPSHPAV
jgi:hypothetical protein